MAVTSRPFANEDDYGRMRDLLVESVAITGPPAYCTIGDLDWWRFTADNPDAFQQAQLWLDGGAVVGFAWPSGSTVDLIVHPAHRPLERQMIAWAEARQRERGDGEPARLTIYALDSDRDRRELLRERGYAPGDERVFHYRHQRIRDVRRAPLPDGYRLRHVTGSDDLERRVAVHRDAFAPSRMTVEKHARVMQAPTYRPELDLVVEALDGSFAAYATVWYDERNRLGVFEPVGCHPAHRRRGLAATVMLEGLRRLRELGAESAVVLCGAGEVGPNRLYESTGFELLDRDVPWSRTPRDSSPT